MTSYTGPQARCPTMNAHHLLRSIPRRVGRHSQRGVSVVEMLLAIAVFAVVMTAQGTITQSRRRADVSEAVTRQYKAIGAAVAANVAMLGVTGAAWTQVSASTLVSVGAIPIEMTGSNAFRSDANGTTPMVYANGAGGVLVIGGPARITRVQEGYTRGQLFLIGTAAQQCGAVAPPCAYGAGASGFGTLPVIAGGAVAPTGQSYYGWHN